MPQASPSSLSVRTSLVHALRLDLVGPSDDLGDLREVLNQAPARWYLSGYLIPLDGEQARDAQDDSNEDLDEPGEPGNLDDAGTPDNGPARNRFAPSSLGLSVILPSHAQSIQITARWGDYELHADGHWHRTPRSATIPIQLEQIGVQAKAFAVPESQGLEIVGSARPIGEITEDWDPATRVVSLFLVNRRTPRPDIRKDEGYAFQAEIEVASEVPILGRPDLRAATIQDPDHCIADLQYRDAVEYAVGHNAATNAIVSNGQCKIVKTCWIPSAEVERVAPSDIPGIELAMDQLARLANAEQAETALGGLVAAYETWIQGQTTQTPELNKARLETANDLLSSARHAALRIKKGIELLRDAQCLEAFRIANRVMAVTARQRRRNDPDPKWYPFQLAFLLLNLPAIADPSGPDREVVDLLFFPTGGGKTEAYLGLAAFTLILRRLRNPGIGSAGVAVLMRYTLRLLTLDQLGRAATMICALELERRKDVTKLGEWPFEIGLWVGLAATPNEMGRKGDNNPDSARTRTIAFKNDDRKPSPIPLEACPWCGQKFTAPSFRLEPNQDSPDNLSIRCVSPHCEFAREAALPIVAVDEAIYRRLPCFLIATVDKFASLPWRGRVGTLFGKVQRYDKRGFYGPMDATIGGKLPERQLAPPELIIQDELHLISGPLGTMAGLYESALHELCVATDRERRSGPKIIASTATVRRAQNQIRALFNRRRMEVFPPPGPDRRDSFFAHVVPANESPARLYLGVACQGKSPKVALLRVYLALLGAALKAYKTGKREPENPADSYMTLVGYFNSLRELGGARRLIEDEIKNRASGYSIRRRVGEPEGSFVDRDIAYLPVELTSRVPTNEVANAKRRLALPYSSKDEKPVDIAIATNMISVGLDITRLGLMAVFGQPKTTAEYIQATSRVGRDPQRPGLIVTIFNIHRPRDRSHYERFGAYHATFYRNVEAASVTPFSPRALDKGLAGTLVGLARHGLAQMTPPRAAIKIEEERQRLAFAIEALANRAREQADPQEAERIGHHIHARANDLFDAWSKIAHGYQEVGTGLQYNQREEGGAKPLLSDFLSSSLKNLPSHAPEMKFRAAWSLRDVEPAVNLWVRTLDHPETDIEEEG